MSAKVNDVDRADDDDECEHDDDNATRGYQPMAMQVAPPFSGLAPLPLRHIKGEFLKKSALIDSPHAILYPSATPNMLVSAISSSWRVMLG